MKTYRRIVARILIGNYSNRKPALFSVGPKSKASKFAKGVNSGSALPMQKLDSRQRCKVCTRKKIQNRTNNFWVTCNVYLAPSKDVTALQNIMSVCKLLKYCMLLCVCYCLSVIYLFFL